MKAYDKTGNTYDILDSKEITRGGEGKIIDLGKGKVAKIYLPGIPPIEERKFQELALLSLPFIKPETLLYDSKNKIIGFIMSEVPKDCFPFFSLFNKAFCQREGITNQIKDKIFEKVVAGVKVAHNSKITIGDLNPYNIMCNDSGEVFFIDVDSYETSTIKHSGRLLDDIRDYLLNGIISTKSDFFALAVILFNASTFIHPFKGVHPKYKSLRERMIYKISVLSGDKDLIIPKCYEKLINKLIEEQYINIFQKGDRFLVELHPSAVKPLKPIKKVIKTNDLIVHEILSDENIKYIESSDIYAVICTDEYQYLIDLTQKGTFSILHKDKYNGHVFCSYGNFWVWNGIELYLIDRSTYKLIPSNFKIKSKSSKYNLFENILMVIDDDFMYKINLGSFMITSANNITSVTVNIDYKNVFGKGIMKTNSLFQNVSGKSIIFYELKGALNQILYNNLIKNIYQKKEYIYIESIINGTIDKSIYRFKGMNIEKINYKVDSIRYFDKIGEYLLISDDDKLVFIRPEDGQVVVEFKCDNVDTFTQVNVTHAGILLVNENEVYLVNKKV